jgi:protein-disulfide isomerase
MSRKKSTATRRAESQAAAERAAVIRREQERAERRRRVVVIAVVLVVVAVLATLLVAYLNKSDKPSTAPQGAVASYAVPAGPSSAPVKVTVYEDFLCPFCGQFEAATRDSLQKQVDAGKVQVQYRVLNFLGSGSSDYSSRAANALAVVLDTSGQKAAKKFHDLLFDHQPPEGGDGLSDAQLVDYAVEAGAPRATVTADVQSRTFEKWVDDGADQASKQDKVRSTPTVQVDGKTLKFTTIDGLVSELEKAVAAGS